MRFRHSLAVAVFVGVAVYMFAGATSSAAPAPAPTSGVLGLVDVPATAHVTILPATPIPLMIDTEAPQSRLGRPAVSVPTPVARTATRPLSSAKAVFLGDSYTIGFDGSGLGAKGWPQIVAAAQAWHVVNLAVAGSGFLNQGWTGQPIGSRVSAAIRAKPDIVFLAGGHNDSRWTASTTAAAADEVINRLHAALPDATLVIIAPIWQSGSPPQRCLDLRDHLRRKAAAVGAIFIDPLAERWFAGHRESLIGPDGIHPTNAGHRYMAAQILARLRLGA